MKETNVGVIGVGAMGYNHVRIYSELKCANLLAISDMMRGTLDQVSKEFNTVGYVDYDNILQIEDITAVNICVPTVFHKEVVLRAIEAGKNVLVEKPIAPKLPEAREMIKAAEEAGVKLMTGHVERFNPAVQKAKELLDQEIIGNIELFKTELIEDASSTSVRSPMSCPKVSLTRLNPSTSSISSACCFWVFEFLRCVLTLSKKVVLFSIPVRGSV